jgi:hypothetical protein
MAGVTSPNLVRLPVRQDMSRGPISMPGGSVATLSSFGLEGTTLGPEFDAAGLVTSERVRELEFRASFYYCRQHDWKPFDFNGRMIRTGKVNVTQPLLGGSEPSFYVPLDQRRPSAPYRLSRKMVSAFTGMLFGHGRWPQMRSDDPATQDYCEALVKAAKLEVKLLRARNLGGSSGTAGLSWGFWKGELRVSVHAGPRIHVLAWEDEDERVPAHVTKIVQVAKQEWNEKQRKRVNKLYWKRRDWTKLADVVFHDTEVTSGQRNPWWRINEEETVIHGDGECHFIWLENLPDDEVEGGMDGLPDYDATYEAMNELDIINSVTGRGAALNLDPTVVVSRDASEMKGAVFQKGSDHALFVGEGGDAKYMELTGATIEAGGNLVDRKKAQILETCECIVPDPDVAASAQSSSVALKMLYAPMISKLDIMRHQYGTAIVRLLEQVLRSTRRRVPDPTAETDEDRFATVVSTDEEGNEVAEQVEFYVELPPRVDKEPVLDETGAPTSEVTEVLVERQPGKGNIELEWGPYFKPTAADIQASATGMVTATGNQPVLSQETAVGLMANMLDRDGTQEVVKVQAEAAQRARQQQEQMFPPMGGELPPGGPEQAASEAAVADSQQQADEVLTQQTAVQIAEQTTGVADFELAPTDIGKVVLVNEARKKLGFGPLPRPDGTPDPDGMLTMAEFDAKRKAMAGAEAKVAEKQGTAAVEVEKAKVEASLTPETQAAPAGPAAPPPQPAGPPVTEGPLTGE